MTPVRGAASAVLAPGALVARASWLAASDDANAVLGWLLSFVLVLALGADGGGYWPTAWGWTAFSLLFLCALILVLQERVTLGKVEAVLPAALLGLTLWGAASVAWSASATQPLLETQRTLAYAAAALVALVLLRERSYRSLVGGVWAAITLVACYSLLTRLFPERYGFVDTIAGYRLEAPLGYWNALGIFAAIGIALAFGFAARARVTAVRALAAASTVVLVPTLYFTFSRGAWIALAAGLATMGALDPRRLRLVTVLAVVAPFPALAVWRAWQSEPLTHIGGSAGAVESAGHHFALTLVGLALGAAAAMCLYVALERRVRVPHVVRVVYAALLVLVVVSAVGAVSVRYGSPPTIARHVYGDLGGPSNNVTNGDLNTRLTSLALGQRIPQWRVARDEYAAHPWLGSGLGSYSRYWTQHRPTPFKVLNVHNLYLETLAEQGPIGLGLLVVALGVPLVAAFRARRRALVPAAAGAYVAYLVHAAVDWDWQMPAVTLAALLCGVAMLLAARSAPSSASSLRRLQRVTALVLVALLGVLAFVGLRGNQAIAASRSAAARGDVAAAAAHARTARFWAPWSSQPWQLLAESQAATNHDAAARTSLERALAKDREDWNIWLDLAIASRGAERRRAFAEATKLNPLGPEIAAWKSATQGRG